MLCNAEITMIPNTKEEFIETKIIAEALKPDDPESGWCKTTFEDGLKIKIETNRIESVQCACEDYFRNIRSGLSAWHSTEIKKK